MSESYPVKFLTTCFIHCSFGDTQAELHLIWYLFCHGDRGLLVWDEGSKYVNDAGAYSKQAKDFTPLYAELTGGIGKLRIASKRTDDPIAIYHSQANLRVHWVREVRATGEDWVLRDSTSERIQSRYVWLRESWVKVIEDNGLQYRFLAPAQAAAGDLRPFKASTGEGFKVLILPELLAMSDAEADAIRRFVTAGGTVIADRMPGEFDEHGKRRDRSPLEDLFTGRGKGRGKAMLLKRDMFGYHQDRLTRNGEADVKARIGRMLTRAVAGDRVTPVVTGPDGKPVTGVETTVWRNGSMELIALHRNPQLRVHELGQQLYTSERKFETRVKLTVRRNRRTVWYDVRKGVKLATGRRVTVTLPPFEPVILAAFDEAVGPFTAAVRRSELRIRPGRPCAMRQAVYHLDFVGPDGKVRQVYRSNVLVPARGAAVPLPVALNDDKGRWTVRIREVATGATQDVAFEVR